MVPNQKGTDMKALLLALVLAACGATPIAVAQTGPPSTIGVDISRLNDGAPITVRAVATEQAVRLTPPTTTTTTTTIPPAPIPGPAGTTVGRCQQYEYLLAEHSPGWDVDRMSKIMWRESNCWPAVQSPTSDSGLLQINRINDPFLRDALGEWVDKWTLTDPTQNVRAAAALYVYWLNSEGSGYIPWKATL